MPVIINGSTGISGTDGSAATPAVQGTDANTGMFFPAADQIAFAEGGTEVMRLTASGDLGLGTSSPNTRLYVAAPSSPEAAIRSAQTGSWKSRISFGNASSKWEFGSDIGNVGNNNFYFYDAVVGAERARITSDGQFIVGATSSVSAGGTIGAQAFMTRSGGSGSFGVNGFNIFWTGVAQLWIDSTNVGNISLTSDYRIKRNVETQMQPALDRIAQLRPVTYQMADYKDLIKASDDIKEGFIAHELAAVIPSAVEGQKDAPDQLQSLKLDALCAVLTKAVQELTAKLEAAEARIATLEAR